MKNTFSYSSDQVKRLAGWFGANPGRGLSVALEFALFPASETSPAIWQDATLSDAVYIARLLEDIQRVASGERKFRWAPIARKTGYQNEPHYINYAFENDAREGLGQPRDPELDEPELFKPAYRLDLRGK